jgi:hypothetical protein
LSAVVSAVSRQALRRQRNGSKEKPRSGGVFSSGARHRLRILAAEIRYQLFAESFIANGIATDNDRNRLSSQIAPKPFAMVISGKS